MVAMIVNHDAKEKRQLEKYILEYDSDSEIHAFEDAELAVEFAHEHEVDLCFTEIAMRRATGFAVNKAVKSHDKFAKVVFLADSPDYALDAWQGHVNGYLLRPVVKEEVDEILKM